MADLKKTKTASAKKAGAKKAGAKKAPKKKLDRQRLGRLADEIGRYEGRDMTNLLHRLETEEGLKFKSASNGATMARMCGVTAQSTAGQRDAVCNWAAAVRRKFTQGGF